MTDEHHYIASEYRIDTLDCSVAILDAINLFRSKYGNDPTINKVNASWNETDTEWEVTIRTENDYYDNK